MLNPDAPIVKPAITAGKPVAAAWLCLGSPTLVELAARNGAQAIVLDLQHGLFDRVGLEASVAAAGAAPVLVRTRDDHPANIGDALDAGAEGVIVPLVETEEAAKAVAEACRFPPQGNRSGGGIRPLADFQAHATRANDAVLAAVMIETKAGVDAAEAIARSGVDMVFIGTGDLALSLGVAPGSKAHEAACQTVLDACKAAKIAAGCFAMGPEAAVARIAQGFAFTVATIDIVAFEATTRAAIDHVRTKAKPPAKTRRRPKAAAPAKTRRTPTRRARKTKT